MRGTDDVGRMEPRYESRVATKKISSRKMKGPSAHGMAISTVKVNNNIMCFFPTFVCSRSHIKFTTFVVRISLEVARS